MDGPWWNHYWLSSCWTCLFCSLLAGTILLSLNYCFIPQLPTAACILPATLQGLWPPVVYIPVGETGNGGAVSARTEAGDSVLWKREKSQRPHCKQGRVWKGVSGGFLEEAMGPGELILLCEEDPKPFSEQKSMHRTSEDRGTMANKRVYRDQGWLYVLRETTDTEDRGRDFHCLKPDKLDTSSEQERISQGLKEENIRRLFSF